MIADWGVPNWTESSAYPTSSTSLNEWRWQFLRRRHDYRKFWMDHVGTTFIMVVTGAEACEHFKAVALAANDQAKKAEHEHAAGVYGCHPDDIFEINKMFTRRSFFGPGSGTTVLNPAWPHYVPGIFPPEAGASSVDYGNDDARMAAIERGLLSIEFDLSLPLKEQLQRAERWLEQMQQQLSGSLAKNTERFHSSKWPMYLRVLDGRDAGATWGRIAEVVLRHQRNEAAAAKQIHKAAVNLMFKVGA